MVKVLKKKETESANRKPPFPSGQKTQTVMFERKKIKSIWDSISRAIFRIRDFTFRKRMQPEGLKTRENYKGAIQKLLCKISLGKKLKLPGDNQNPSFVDQNNFALACRIFLPKVQVHLQRDIKPQESLQNYGFLFSFFTSSFFLLFFRAFCKEPLLQWNQFLPKSRFKVLSSTWSITMGLLIWPFSTF